MTADEYAKQRDELERGIAYAERDYNSAAFRLQTGAAKPEQVAETKAHYEAMKGKLDDLIAAFQGAQVVLKQRTSEAKLAAHKQLCDKVDAFVAKRLSLTKAILKHCEALAAAVSEHEQISREMRSHIHKQGYARRQLEGIDLNFASAASPYTIAGAALNLAGLQSSLITGDRSFFDQQAAENREARFAEQLRGNLKIIAPKEA